jgi:hypothetical protein
MAPLCGVIGKARSIVLETLQTGLEPLSVLFDRGQDDVRTLRALTKEIIHAESEGVSWRKKV